MGAPYKASPLTKSFTVNPAYIDTLQKKGGLRFIGKDEKGERMEIMELRDHP